jgi:hypothetical protein
LLLKLRRRRRLAINLTFQLSHQVLLSLQPSLELPNLVLLTLDEGVQTTGLRFVGVI